MDEKIIDIEFFKFKNVLLPIFKCCSIVTNNDWCERELFLFVVPTIICKKTYMTTLLTRPSIFDRSDHVLLFTFWGLGDQGDVIWQLYGYDRMTMV